MAFDLSDYIDVAARIAELREKHPDASLQSEYKVVEVGGQTFVVCRAECYRTPDDVRPGVGLAWEPFPGKTPYTKDSELQNAETSAWGRAIVASLAADTKRGIASADEVRNRQQVPAATSSRGSGDQALPAPAAGNPDDAWLDVLHNPGGWFDNRADAVGTKKPEFKAKKDNPHWGQAGEPWQGKPQPLALWLRDAPPHFEEAYDAGDPSLMTDDGPTGRGKTVAEATAALAAKVVNEEPAYEPEPGEEAF